MKRAWIVLLLLALLPLRGWAVAGMAVPVLRSSDPLAAAVNPVSAHASVDAPCHGAVSAGDGWQLPADPAPVCSVCDLCHFVALPSFDLAAPPRDARCARVTARSTAFPPDAPPAARDKPPRP
jgi:hypothetical protein